jgi:glycosyltransferase involved in cell wall biosynthesis
MIKEPKISVSMIAKDESADIVNALNSVKSIAQQIVVIDTGSKDETPELCTRHGAEVYFKKWSENFSESRNFATKHCRNEWIISIDADEILDLESFKKESHYLNDKSIGGLNVKIINSLGDNDYSPQSEHRYTRIFRNLPNIEYKGRIHEQILGSIYEVGLEVVETNIIIRHYGYIDTSHEKKIRNKQLLEQEVIDHPEDFWLKFHLAETEFSLGNIEKAKIAYKIVVDSFGLTIEQSERTRIRLSQIALAEDDIKSLQEWCNFKSMDVNRDGLRKFILGAGYMTNKQFSLALELYKSDEVQNSNMVDRNRVNDAISALSTFAVL